MSDEKALEKKIGEKVPGEIPLVSVVIPAYNVADFIRETLDSALSQTFRNFEIILVNDGSPDTEKLEEVLRDYFPQIIYIKQKNGGAASARNTAINAARGELLAFLDGDDLWFPEYLEEQVKALEAANCDLIYADALLFGCVSEESETFMKKSPSSGAVTTESLIKGNCNVITSGTVTRREAVVRCGAFDEELPRIGMEDYDLWFRLARAGARLDFQQRVLLKYRVRAGSLSGSNVQRAERSIVGLDTLARKHELSKSEKKAMAESRAEAEAELELEKGKYHLACEDFSAARACFRRANRYYRKIKLEIIIALLKISPGMVSKIFKKMRPDELSFIAPEVSKKNSVSEPAAENCGN